MARLEQVITNIVDIFLEYADDDNEGSKSTLNKAELQKVLEREIQSPELKGKINPLDIEEALTILDKNHDGEINFNEFCRCVNVLAKCYYHKKTGKGGGKGGKRGKKGRRGKGKEGEEEDEQEDEQQD